MRADAALPRLLEAMRGFAYRRAPWSAQEYPLEEPLIVSYPTSPRTHGSMRVPCVRACALVVLECVLRVRARACACVHVRVCMCVCVRVCARVDALSLQH
jgi:hypothetical protein